MKYDSLDLTGQLSLIQLAHVIQLSVLFIGNDSAPMHVASYCDKPIIAFFGPTDPNAYGPWSRQSKYLQHQTNCQACLVPTIAHHECIRAVTLEEAVAAFTINGNQVFFNKLNKISKIYSLSAPTGWEILF